MKNLLYLLGICVLLFTFSCSDDDTLVSPQTSSDSKDRPEADFARAIHGDWTLNAQSDVNNLFSDLELSILCSSPRTASGKIYGSNVPEGLDLGTDWEYVNGTYYTIKLSGENANVIYPQIIFVDESGNPQIPNNQSKILVRFRVESADDPRYYGTHELEFIAR
ncbi:hypothetical protein [Persicobacter sp. CCB-QB2]|uniref:hypothetical protein n=1 Tax=Persicobacter sp. CCB-QB2 TaxID=1561025 RepID=UPI0012F87D75|nr:hypothetical protein [Persicobacter sp. CCB-QB2]